MLTALTPGMVTVTATANDGSGVSGSEQITITSNPALHPQLSNLGQFTSDGTTAIAENGNTSGNTVVFQGTFSSPGGYPAQLQVEVQLVGTAFTGYRPPPAFFLPPGGLFPFPYLIYHPANIIGRPES
jgi:hypothetical protein